MKSLSRAFNAMRATSLSSTAPSTLSTSRTRLSEPGGGPERGFYRVTLGRMGNIDCSPQRHIYGKYLRRDQCFVVTKLTEKPRAGVQFAPIKSERVQGTFLSPLTRRSHELVQLPTRTVIAQAVAFRYYSPMTRLFGESVPTYSCPDPPPNGRELMKAALVQKNEKGELK